MTWCWWQEFCSGRSWFQWHIQWLFSRVFQWIVGVLWLTADWYRQEATSCRAVIPDGHSRQWCVHFFCIFTASYAKKPFSNGYWGVVVFCIIFSMNMLNSTWDNGHPCHTLTVVQKKSLTLPFSNTALFASWYNDLMTSISRRSLFYCLRLARGHLRPHTIECFLDWSRLILNLNHRVARILSVWLCVMASDECHVVLLEIL